MKRCPITYEEIPESAKYSSSGLRLLGRNLGDLNDLPYSAEEQLQEAVLRATKMSIQGLQPKLSARVNVPERTLELVDTAGELILKPPTQFPEVPANEGLTMELAHRSGIEVPVHGMVYAKDGSFTYFVKRFDRTTKGKLQVEDFGQLLGMTRDTKYESSMEQIAAAIDRHCTFPVVEKVKILRLVLFNFLVGNEDAHVKNFSLISREGKVELSPAYDLLNTTIILRDATEEIALPLKGRKRKLDLELFLDYFANERLQLTTQAISDVREELARASMDWDELIQKSFLSNEMKTKYLTLVRNRRTRIGMDS